MTATGKIEKVSVDSVALYHRNPRLGDVPAIKESLRANGVYRPIVVNRGTSTGRANEVLAGNHTVMAARELLSETGDKAWSSLPAWVVDVDDDRAARIVLADNRTPELGGFDDDVLLELLRDLDGDFEGTAYTDMDLDKLLPPDLEDFKEPLPPQPPAAPASYPSSPMPTQSSNTGQSSYQDDVDTGARPSHAPSIAPASILLGRTVTCPACDHTFVPMPSSPSEAGD